MFLFPLSSIPIFRIARISNGWPPGVRILSVLLALATTFLVLFTTAPNGIALTPDSVGYVSAARSLSTGKGLTLYDSSPLTMQAPLYPALLSLLEQLSGLDPITGARFFNAGLYGLIVYLSGLLFQRRLANPSLVVVGLAAVSLSPVLFSVSTYALTEPLFILWTLVFLLLLDDYLNARSPALLILLAIVAGLASLTRYFGISLCSDWCSSDPRTSQNTISPKVDSPYAVWCYLSSLFGGMGSQKLPPGKYALGRPRSVAVPTPP